MLQIIYFGLYLIAFEGFEQFDEEITNLARPSDPNADPCFGRGGVTRKPRTFPLIWGHSMPNFFLESAWPIFGELIFQKLYFEQMTLMNRLQTHIESRLERKFGPFRKINYLLSRL